MVCKLLIVAAIPEELTGLNLSHTSITVGIGAVRSSIGLLEKLISMNNNQQKFTQNSLMIESPLEIFLIGSAGKFTLETKHQNSLGCIAQTFSAIDVSVCEGRAQLPSLQPAVIVKTQPGPYAKKIMKSLSTNQQEDPTWALESAHINSTQSITKANYGKSLRQFLDTQNIPQIALAENIEAYAIAQIAKHYGIYFTACLAYTNRVDETSSRDWQKSFRRKMKLLNTLITQRLSKS